VRTCIFLAVGSFLTLCTISLAAQTSSSFGRADKYRAAKTILQEIYDQGDLSSGIEKNDNGEVDEYDLSRGSTCQEPSEYLGSFESENVTTGERSERPQHKNDDIAAFVLDEVNIVVWQNDLRKLNIPDSVWRPVLDIYEASIINPKAKGFNMEIMAGGLNRRMAQAGLSKPKFVFQPGCGSGGASVHFALQPADGQLFLIPVFLYKLCQAQHVSPLDFKSCDRWKEIFSERVWAVSGDYMYLARWSDGVVRCGKLTYDDIDKFGQKWDGFLTITELRSPECNPVF
jgi:hypothetical protein